MFRWTALLLAAPLLIAAAPLDEFRDALMKDDTAAAKKIAEAASAAGDPEGHAMLASLYANGAGVKRDPARALALYRQAAEAGLPLGQWRLGLMLDAGEGLDAPQPEEAFKWIKAAADQNFAPALTSLAVLYAEGRGTGQDFFEAMRNYQRAAAIGQAHAFYGLGVMNMRGQAAPEDIGEGLAFMFVAATLGDPSASDTLRALVPELDPSLDAALATRGNEIAAQYLRRNIGLTAEGLAPYRAK